VGFDEVLSVVKSGDFDAGIIIHEGQITHQKEGFKLLLDLGQWWWEEYALSLPLGVNIIKKDLGDEAIKISKQALFDTIKYSLDHRDAAIEYALTYGRGISTEEADTFVGMYVNELTLDIGEPGKKSIKLFLEKGVEYGFIPDEIEVEFR
ncbi:MAG: hypothetical protein KDD42_08160, partial [Bdellovibrionales bacterium]|nr:hypothetical protein [Bdellovibrionales bacterium]